jgi:hypothetical protein
LSAAPILIRKAKASVAVPIIGSLNGVSRGGWIRYAREIEQAGADAIELNIYSIATDPQLTAGQVEHGYVELVAAVKQSVRIPVAVKLSPFFSAPAPANTPRNMKAHQMSPSLLLTRFCAPAARELEALFSLVHRVFLVAPLGDEEAGLADPSLECFGPLNFGRDCTTKENNLSISRKAASVRFRSPVASRSR